jgi:glycosyltransferase involved in cell wall biosynthesis
MGNRLNSWHSRIFVPLLDRFEFMAFMASKNVYPTEDIPFPIVRLPYEDEVCGFLRRKWLHAKYRLLHPLTGCEFSLRPFWEKLAPFEIIHSWELFTEWSRQAVEAKRRFNSKLLVTVWDTIPFHFHEDPIRNGTREAVLEHADAFLVYTEKSRAVLILEGVKPERIFKISPGLDLEAFPARRTGEDVPPATVLFVGRQHPEKGLRHLLFAWYAITKEFPGAKLRIVGSGREKESNMRLAERLQISSSIEFIENVAYTRMAEIYSSADVFVLPSVPTNDWEEQFAMALIEAMASGLPAVATLTGAIPEMLGSAGLLVPPADFPALEDALRYFLKNPEECKKYGALARRRAEEMFPLQKSSKELERIYRTL